MADKYGMFSKSFSGGERSYEEGDEDFDEEEIWSVVKEKSDTSTAKHRKLKGSSASSSGSRMIPKANAASSTTHGVRLHKASAPISIPSWSSIRNKNMRKTWVDGDNNDDVENSDDEIDEDGDNEDEEEEEEEEEDGKVPPHEWIAKKLSRSQISSFSVHEGVGRTLKGRDLSTVRNAVLSRTGFLE